MILVYEILLAGGLLAMLSAIIFWGWRASRVTQRGAQEDFLKGCIKDWRR